MNNYILQISKPTLPAGLINGWLITRSRRTLRAAKGKQGFLLLNAPPLCLPVKKGNESVGVGWQYCGNVGKPANSQVAVMACLCNGDFASLVDAQLYLPQDWINDPARCDKVGIPKDRCVFKTKPELAIQIVKNQIKMGADIDFVGADGLYGNDLAFVNHRYLGIV